MTSIRILLADDHVVVREGLKLILEAQPGVSVAGQASDGKEAVTLAARLKPDVIVMDIAMPGLNGIEATQEICRLKHPPRVVILSMYATPEHIYRAFKAGAQGYLLKESAGRELLKAVLAVQEGHSYVSEKVMKIMVEGYSRAGDFERENKILRQLSPREKEVMRLVVEGKSSAEIAPMFHLSRKTVDTYRSRLMQKLGVTDLPGLVRYAIAHGLINAE